MIEADSVRAMIGYRSKTGRTCILNFADYKRPGGMFLQGSNAQEEALCHESTLYPVLQSFYDTYYANNRKSNNRGLYRNKAIYTKDIIFERDGIVKTADVLTCAAPNWNTAYQYYGVTREENNIEVKERIKFMARILLKENVDTFIAGAWGCGVFGQDPKWVAECMAACFASVSHVIYAIPDSGSRSYEAFKEVF